MNTRKLSFLQAPIFLEGGSETKWTGNRKLQDENMYGGLWDYATLDLRVIDKALLSPGTLRSI